VPPAPLFHQRRNLQRSRIFVCCFRFRNIGDSLVVSENIERFRIDSYSAIDRRTASARPFRVIV